FSRATNSAALPATNGTTGPGVTLTTTAANTSAVTVGSNNTIRGMTFGNVTDTAITGSGFGSLTIKDAAINTTGARALSLTRGTQPASGAGVLVASSSAAVTFKSVTQNGGANGIVLSSTTGSFVVNGSGNTSQGGDSSGGTIQSTTGVGILLTSTKGVQLNNMK